MTMSGVISLQGFERQAAVGGLDPDQCSPGRGLYAGSEGSVGPKPLQQGG
jgi:hypothetical protein